MNRAAAAVLALFATTSGALAADCEQIRDSLRSALEAQQQFQRQAIVVKAQTDAAAAVNDISEVQVLHEQIRHSLYEYIGHASSLKQIALELQSTPGYCGLKPEGIPTIIKVADDMTTLATDHLSKMPQ